MLGIWSTVLFLSWLLHIKWLAPKKSLCYSLSQLQKTLFSCVFLMRMMFGFSLIDNKIKNKRFLLSAAALKNSQNFHNDCWSTKHFSVSTLSYVWWHRRKKMYHSIVSFHFLSLFFSILFYSFWFLQLGLSFCAMILLPLSIFRTFIWCCSSTHTSIFLWLDVESRFLSSFTVRKCWT